MGLVRCPYAHAKILSVDLQDALREEGVIAAVTGDEVASRTPPLPIIMKPPNMKEATRYALAVGSVKYSGQPIAAIAATSRALAEDAIEMVKAEYEPLPVVSDPEEALKPSSPVVYDGWDNNLVYSHTFSQGDIDDAFEKADHVISEKLTINRMAASPIETRGLIASYDPKQDFLTAWMTTQHPHLTREFLAGMLKIDEASVRVVCPDVGGAFGSKGGLAQPEILVASILSMKTSRPVKWIEDRTEHFNNLQSRGQVHDIQLAVTKDGEILGLKDDFYVDVGVVGYFSMRAPVTSSISLINGYKIKNFQIKFSCVGTNKPGLGPVRGYGMVEPTYVIERMMDKIASKLNLDPAAVRMKNFVQSEEMPYNTGMPLTYDSGDYQECLKRVLTMAEYERFREEQNAARKEGKHLGIGIAFHCSLSGVGPSRKMMRANYETSTVRLESSGKVTIISGIKPQGQGQETTLAQLCAHALQMDPNDMTLIQGDTSLVPSGSGTHASRSAVVGGSAVYMASQKVAEKVRRVAAHILNVPYESVVLKSGAASSADGRTLSMKEIVVAAYERLNLPQGMEPGLEATATFDPPDLTINNGAHVAKVSVDIETGIVDVLKYYVVSDCGTLINPMIVEGQVRGGVAHGIGDALHGEIVYDSNGQLLTSNFMGYLLPSAPIVP